MEAEPSLLHSDMGSEPPPSLPVSVEALPAPASRSELLERRRSETRDYLQGTYDAWESANPVWAQRLTGAAVNITDYPDDPNAGSRQHMMRQRRVSSRDMAMRSSGYSEEVQERLCEHEPNQLVTSLSRMTHEPTTAWVEKPDRGGSRSKMVVERKQLLIHSLHAAAEASRGVLDQNERVLQRVDQDIQALLSAPPGASRAALLAARRQRRAKENEDIAAVYGVDPAASFAAQDLPFWKVAQMEAAALQEANGGGGADEQRPPKTALSLEELKAVRKWYAKPEMYTKVSQQKPRYTEPFKLSADDARFLQRKLSSGPRKAQRGYPPEAKAIADKVGNMPAPDLTQTIDPKMLKQHPFRAFTDPQFKFGAPEPKDTAIYLANPTMADGYEFTQPLYSSFNKAKVYVAPRLPPRPKGVRPSTTPGGSRSRAARPQAPPQQQPPARPGPPQGSSRSGALPASAPSGLTGGMGPDFFRGAASALPVRPGTAATLRPLSMASLTSKGSRGGSASMVRSGGFQLISTDLKATDAA